ncbi:MAG: hypothetical protein KDH09_12175 [Chrysiogenetes bacterium]|nr:hypothetical protein [Chrysiogenetes bacterium]
MKRFARAFSLLLAAALLAGCGATSMRRGDRVRPESFSRSRTPIEKFSFGFDLVLRSEGGLRGDVDQRTVDYATDEWRSAQDAVEQAFESSYQFVNLYPAPVPRTWRADIRLIKHDPASGWILLPILTGGAIPAVCEEKYVMEMTLINPEGETVGRVETEESARFLFASVAYFILILAPAPDEAQREIARDLALRSLREASKQPWWPGHVEEPVETEPPEAEPAAAAPAEKAPAEGAMP